MAPRRAPVESNSPQAASQMRMNETGPEATARFREAYGAKLRAVLEADFLAFYPAAYRAAVDLGAGQFGAFGQDVLARLLRDLEQLRPAQPRVKRRAQHLQRELVEARAARSWLERLRIDTERADYWHSKGAQISDRVSRLLKDYRQQ